MLQLDIPHVAAQQYVAKQQQTSHSTTMRMSELNRAHVKAQQGTFQSSTEHMSELNRADIIAQQST